MTTQTMKFKIGDGKIKVLSTEIACLSETQRFRVYYTIQNGDVYFVSSFGFETLEQAQAWIRDNTEKA